MFTHHAHHTLVWPHVELAQFHHAHQLVQVILVIATHGNHGWLDGCHQWLQLAQFQPLALHPILHTLNQAHHVHGVPAVPVALPQLLPFLSIVPLFITLFAKILKLPVFNVTQELTVNTL